MSLVARIKNEIGSCLERSEDLQIPLTVQGLSQHYGVSYTPVREAIGELIETGLIRKKATADWKPLLPKNAQRNQNSEPKRNLKRNQSKVLPKNWWKSVLGGKSVLFAKKQPHKSMALPVPPFAKSFNVWREKD